MSIIYWILFFEFFNDTAAAEIGCEKVIWYTSNDKPYRFFTSNFIYCCIYTTLKPTSENKQPIQFMLMQPEIAQRCIMSKLLSCFFIDWVILSLPQCNMKIQSILKSIHTRTNISIWEEKEQTTNIMRGCLKTHSESFLGSPLNT